MKKTRILLLTTYIDDGGAEGYLMTQLSHMPMQDLEIDYFTLFPPESDRATNFYSDLGVRIYSQDMEKRFNLRCYFKYFNLLKEFIHQHGPYDALHVNGCNLPIQYIACYVAKCANIPVRIVHSHNTRNTVPSLVHRIAEAILQWMLAPKATNFVGCSIAAGRSKYGKKIVESPKFCVMKNGIETERFIFNEGIRKKIREEQGISENFVVGHIGRFELQKNHDFLIDIFYQLYLKNDDSRLLLIGDGSLLPQIKNKIRDLKIEHAVIFTGFIENANEYLQAMDTLCLPSLYEGLCIAAVEAQASGLPVVVANTLPNEAKLTDLLTFMSLSDPPSAWADKMMMFFKNSSRHNMYNEIVSTGYEVNVSAARLLSLYQTGK